MQPPDVKFGGPGGKMGLGDWVWHPGLYEGCWGLYEGVGCDENPGL